MPGARANERAMRGDPPRAEDAELGLSAPRGDIADHGHAWRLAMGVGVRRTQCRGSRSLSMLSRGQPLAKPLAGASWRSRNGLATLAEPGSWTATCLALLPQHVAVTGESASAVR